MEVQSTRSMNPPIIVRKIRQNLVEPDQTLTPRQIMDRFLKTGNMGKVEVGSPQYQDQEGLSLDSPDFLKLKDMDRLDQIDASRELKSALDKARKKAEKARADKAEAQKELSFAQKLEKAVNEKLAAMKGQKSGTSVETP